jgi:hypothetical protein
MKVKEKFNEEQAMETAEKNTWMAANKNVIAVGAFIYVRDFMVWLQANFKNIDLGLDTKSEFSTVGELKQAAEKLCAYSEEDVSQPANDGPHKFTSKAHVPSRCFHATYIPYVLESWGIPLDMKIRFLKDATIDWARAFFSQEVKGISPKGLDNVKFEVPSSFNSAENIREGSAKELIDLYEAKAGTTATLKQRSSGQTFLDSKH